MTWSLTWAIAAVLVVTIQCQEDPQDGKECVPQGDGGDYRLKHDDCTYFWNCQYKEGIDRYIWVGSKCVNGTVFNENTRMCEPPRTTIKCKGYVEPKLIPTMRSILPGCENRFICPVDLQFFIYPDWNDCRKYYDCQQGIVSSYTCEQTYFNPITFACTNALEPNNPCANRL